MSRLISEMRAYFTYRRQTRTDFTFLYVIAILILIFGERFVLWIIGLVTPAVAADLVQLNYFIRILSLGLPFSLVFLIIAWWLDWRSIKRNPVESHNLNNNLGEAYDGVIEDAQALPVIHALQRLRSQIPPIPTEYGGERMSQLSDAPTRFDPNRWFEVFSHVRPQPGYVLDFVYRFWGNGGFPLLYLRRENETRLKSCEEYWQRFGGASNTPVPHGNKPLLEHLKYDATPEGYFEFVVFYINAPRFHLHWHNQAGEIEFIVSHDALAQVLSGIATTTIVGGSQTSSGLAEPQGQQLLTLDPRPKIWLGNNGRSALVTLLVWELGESFAWKRYCVNYPYQPVESETQLILRYGTPKVY